MTRPEFAKIAAYLSVGTGKPLSPEGMEVYFDCLGDLPFGVMQLAAKRVLLEHPWATFPSVAELRLAASESTRGEVNELASGRAWELAWKAAGRIDLEVDGSIERATSALPPTVVEAMNRYGMVDLCRGKQPVSVVRSQFMEIFDQLATRDRREALLPPATRAALDQAREQYTRKAIAAEPETASAPIRSVLGRIGQEVPA
jgi:hypothetical protein